jgi:23S rRNA (uracil1939-C5)-methyltransferase
MMRFPTKGDNIQIMVPGKGKTVELRIEKTAHGGQGVARLEGFVIFVRGGVPGDRVLARVTRKKREYAEALIEELLEPSDSRTSAPCPYFGHCGGCQWQHIRYRDQLRYKREHVREALAHIGSLRRVPVHDVIPSERQYAYRNKMEFSFSDRRWLLPQEMAQQGDVERGFALGLHVPGTFHKVIDIEACMLQQETGNRILREVKAFARDSGLPPYGLKSHRGFWRFLTLRHSLYSDEWMVNLITSRESQDALKPLARGLSRRFADIRTIVNNINSRRAGIAVGEREVTLTGEGTLEDRIGPYCFRISANSFFQTNPLGAEKLYQQVATYAELRGEEVVLDLYSGTGTIPIFLAGSARLVLGLEIEQSAIKDAERNCTANRVDNCRFVLGDIRERLSSLEIKPDVLVIDPPRAGMHKDVLAKVMDLATDRVIYVSCNPATLARDLETLNQLYEILEIQPVDMFPQTYHVEAVARLVRRR